MHECADEKIAQNNYTEGNDDVNHAIHIPDPMWDQPGTSGEPSGIFLIII